MYTGKNQMIKVDLDNLLNSKVSDIESIRYDVAKKNPEFISAVEVAVEDCTGNETDIHDEVSYKLAITSLVMLIENENKEESVMGTVKGNMSAAVGNMMDKFDEAKENIKVNAGETKEEYFDRVDDSLNIVKGAFGDVLGKVDSLLGFTVLKDKVLAIIEAGCNENTLKKDLFKMARKCREIIEKDIEEIELIGNPDDAETLKELLGSVKGESIFKMFFGTMVWIAKRVTRKLRKWFKVDEGKSVMGSICRSIGGFAGILRAGAKIVWNTAKFAVSFVIAGVIKVADFIYRAIMTVIGKIQMFIVFKHEKLTQEDLEDDFEEDLDDDFFADDEE